MPGFDFVQWLLDGPLWIMAAPAVPVILYFAVFAGLRRSSAVADPPPGRGPGRSAGGHEPGGD